MSLATVSQAIHIIYLVGIVALVQIGPFLIVIVATAFILRALLKTPQEVLDTPRRLVDLMLSSLFLAIMAPLMAVILLLLRLNVGSSSGPLIYKSRRCGLKGKEFNVYRFRTMVPGADEMVRKYRTRNVFTSPFFYIPINNDPRITKLGSFLRKTGFDELPVLVNVLKGDMSFFGLRALTLKETMALKELLPKSSLPRARFSLRPGFISLWDIYAYRRKIRHAFVLEKQLNRNEWIDAELSYIRDRSAFLNMEIILRYIPILVGRILFEIKEVKTETGEGKLLRTGHNIIK